VQSSGSSATANPLSQHFPKVRPVNVTQSAAQSGLICLPSAKHPVSTFSGFQLTGRPGSQAGLSQHDSKLAAV